MVTRAPPMRRPPLSRTQTLIRRFSMTPNALRPLRAPPPMSSRIFGGGHGVRLLQAPAKTAAIFVLNHVLKSWSSTAMRGPREENCPRVRQRGNAQNDKNEARLRNTSKKLTRSATPPGPIRKLLLYPPELRGRQDYPERGLDFTIPPAFRACRRFTHLP